MQLRQNFTNHANKNSATNTEQQLKQERAFLELIDYMKNEAENGVALFPMAELNKQYNERKVELGLPPETNHLKNE